MATPTGIQLIDTIHEKLLTSVELTGIWEKKLRDIEHHRYQPAQFIEELKQQVNEIVTDVMHDNSNRTIEGITPEEPPVKPKSPAGTATVKTTGKTKPRQRRKQNLLLQILQQPQILQDLTKAIFARSVDRGM